MIPLLLLLVGCTSSTDREMQLFVAGDIKNAAAIAVAANDTLLVDCLRLLEPAAMASPEPQNDGLFVVAARAEVIRLAVSGKCGSLLAPLLLRVMGKVSGPFGLLLPF